MFYYLRRLRERLVRRLAIRLVAVLHDVPHIYGQHPLTLGTNVSLANAVLNLRSGSITIEDDVIFGHNVMVLTGWHDYRQTDGKRPTVTEETRPIWIGRGAWIASGAILVGPVRIGRQSVVAAGAVVTRDVPDGVMVAGVPAVVVKKIAAGEVL